jgi:hypothetical protein
MQMRALRKKTASTGASLLPVAFVCLMLVAACLLGAGVVGISGGSSSLTLAAGALAFVAVVGAACLVLELPVLTLVRFAFIASFFFKADLNFYKIDEIEDPSGFNISLTLITGLILLIYDRFADEDGGEKLFPPAFSILLALLFVCAAFSVLYGGLGLLGWFSLWSFSTSILIAAAVASHFSRRERLIELIAGVSAGLVLTGATALSQYVFDFPTNSAFFGTGTEDEMLGTQSQILSRVPAFLRTPTEMAWVVSALIPVALAPVICRVKSLKSRQRVFFPAAAFAGVVAVILSLARGSWLSLLVGVFLIIFFGWTKLSAAERKTYFASACGFIVFAALLLVPFSNRIYDRLTEDDQGSALIRVPMMENAKIIRSSASA